ncbi:MAG: hypothetical protein P8L85_11035 [Rubripirellula sp.]|nr:hypothetical protein [Rubripirellula sp.]
MIRTTRTLLIVWISALSMMAGGTVAAATPTVSDDDTASKKTEIFAVFRISKAFLAEVTDRKITADIPFCANVLKFQCTGVIHGEGKIAIDLQESRDKAIFEVTSRGTGQTCVKGVRGPLLTFGSAWGTFTSRTLVQFDGQNFRHVNTIPAATVRADIQRVTGRRDRPLGKFLGSGIQPLADNLIPKALTEATPIANQYLQDFIEETAAKIIAQLNEKLPIEDTVNRLFPETQEWQFQMSADDDFLQTAYGPAGAPTPVLPNHPTAMKQVRLEAWLRSTNEEAKLLAEMSKRPLAKQLVQRYLETTLPELADFAEERSVDAVGSWVVIRVGTSKPN